MKIVILARKNLQYNTRVERQAKALAQAGHQVRVVTLLVGDQSELEFKDGYEIVRLRLHPVHQRIPQLLSRTMGAVIRGIALVERRTLGLLRGAFLILRSAVRQLLQFLRWGLRTLRSGAVKLRSFVRKCVHKLKSSNMPSHASVDPLQRDLHSPLREEGSSSDLSAKLLLNPESLKEMHGSSMPSPIFKGESRDRASQMVAWCFGFARRGLRSIYHGLYFALREAYLAALRLIRWIARKIKGLVRVSFQFVTKVIRSALRPFAQPATTFDFTLRAYRLLRNDPADIYQAHDSPALAAAYLLARRHEARFVYDAVEIATGRTGQQLGPIGTFVGRAVGRLWEGFFIKRAAAVITPTPGIGERLHAQYRVNPVLILNCTWYKGADQFYSEEKNLRSELSLSNPKTKILFYSGTISAPNGVGYLIRCLRYLPEQVALVLLGPMQPRYQPICESLIEVERVQNRVFILPPVPPEEVIFYAASADVGVIPHPAGSLNVYALLPNKFFEYLMARLPIVAPDFPALRQIIEKENVGRLYEPSNIKDMARAIQEVLEPTTNSKLRANLERSARNYSWESEAQKLIALYERLARGEHGFQSVRTPT